MEKKKMKLCKKILIVIAILILLVMIITIRKFIIISNLEKISKNIQNCKNFHAEAYTIQGNNVNIRKIYNKDSKCLTTIQAFGIDITEKRELTTYEDENSTITVVQSGKTKIAFLDRETLGGNDGIYTFSTNGMSNVNKFFFSLLIKIKTEECNNKECYLIETQQGWKIWVDKQTGIIVREINENSITDYNYKFDIVKDEDIIKPDISDCKIQENK